MWATGNILNFHLTCLRLSRSGDPNFESTDTECVASPNWTKVCLKLKGTITKRVYWSNMQGKQGSLCIIRWHNSGLCQQKFPIKRRPVTVDIHNPISHESGCVCPDSGPCGWVVQLFLQGNDFLKMLIVTSNWKN